MVRYALRLLAKKMISSGRRRLLGPNAEAVLYRSGEFRFLVAASDFTIGRKLGFDGTYQPEEMDYLRKLVADHEIHKLLVVGSHVGIFAVGLSPFVEKVWALEPNPETYRLLSFNIANNGVSNVTAMNVAASDREEPLTFWPGIENTGGSKVALPGASLLVKNDADKPISVPGIPADQLQIEADMVLMDVEGHEIQALRGLRRTLAKAKVLSCELIPSLLEEAGFTVKDQIEPLRDSFDLFWIDDCSGEPKTADAVENYFETLTGDARKISRNLICVKSGSRRN